MVGVAGIKDGLLLEEWQQPEGPTHIKRIAGLSTSWKILLDVCSESNRQTNLFQVVATIDPSACFPSLLDSG